MKITTADWISIAAGAVALVSAIFTGIGLRWAKQSARAAQTAATAAQQSANADQQAVQLQSGQDTPGSAPRFAGAVKRQPGGNKELVLTLKSPRELTGMDVSVTEAAGIWFIPGTPGVHPEPPEFIGLRSFRAFAFDLGTSQPAGLQPGQSVQWAVKLKVTSKPPATLNVEADCRDGEGHQWPAVSVSALVDPEPQW